MYLFSDGTYEIFRPDGSLWSYEGFVRVLASPAPEGVSDLDHIVASIKAIRGSEVFDDDSSLLKVCFQQEQLGS